jgi:hypothetical protein
MRAAGYHLLQRIRHFAWLTLLAGILMLLAAGGSQTVGSGAQPLIAVAAPLSIILLAMNASYRSFATYVRAENRRDNAAADFARLDGVNLAANTLRHHIGNKLAVAVGYSEMLADDPRLPVDVQEQANKVLRSAMAAAAVLHKLDTEVVRIELDRSVAGPKLLDVDASVHHD